MSKCCKPRDISFIFFLFACYQCMPILVELRGYKKAIMSFYDFCFLCYLIHLFSLLVHMSFSTAGAMHGESVLQVYGWTNGGDRWFMTWTCLIYCVIILFPCRKEVIETRKCCLTPVSMHSFDGKAPVTKSSMQWHSLPHCVKTTRPL